MKNKEIIKKQLIEWATQCGFYDPIEVAEKVIDLHFGTNDEKIHRTQQLFFTSKMGIIRINLN